jgi:hypothetical protein
MCPSPGLDPGMGLGPGMDPGPGMGLGAGAVMDPGAGMDADPLYAPLFMLSIYTMGRDGITCALLRFSPKSLLGVSWVSVRGRS